MILKFIFAMFVSFQCHAEKTVKFIGEASRDGKLVYTEKHEVTYGENGSVLTAVTNYEGPDGTLLAKMNSDFTKSLSMPEHVYTDEKEKNSYGIRRSDGKVVMFEKAEDGKEKNKALEENFGRDRLEVGCQGLNYYLAEKMENVRQKREVPVVLMVPGNLDTYDFKLRLLQEADGIADFEVVIESWFLRLFAPKLKFKYDTKNKRMVHYEGISNIKDSSGKVQKVVINYKYD